MPAWPNGYNYRKELTLSAGSALTDYVSTPEDGITVTIGSGTDSGSTVFIDSAKVQASLIDVILTDDSDNIIPFDWAFRKPGDKGLLRWKKASVGTSETLRLYYGKSDATYQGADIDTFTERWNNYGVEAIREGYFDTSRSDYIALHHHAISKADNGYCAVVWSQESDQTTHPEYFCGLYDLFTRSFRKTVRVGANTATDPHNHAACCFDQNGRIHVFAPRGGSSTILHWSSATPYDLDFGSSSAIAGTAPNAGAYYVQPIVQSDGTMWLFWRDWSMYYLTSTDNGSTWSSATEVVRHGAGGSTERVYGWVALDESTDDILQSYSESAGTGGWEHTGFLYWDESASAWKAADGTTLTLPASISDASLVENSAGDERLTNPNGPFITAAGNFAFAYGTGAGISSWSTDDLRLREWNGTSWDDTQLLSSGTADFKVSCRLWEEGSTKHAVFGEIVTTTRTDWDERTASSWGGTWTSAAFLFQNRGDLDSCYFEVGEFSRRPLAIATDKADGDILWHDEDNGTYSRTWTTAGASEAQVGRGYCRAIADTNDSYVLAALPSTHNDFRVDFRIWYDDVGSSGRNWFSNLSVCEDVAGYNASGNDGITIGLRGDSSPLGLSIGVRHREAGANTDSTTWGPESVGQELRLSLTWDQTNGQVDDYADDQYSTISNTQSVSNAMSSVLDVIGFNQAASGSSATTQNAKYYLGPIHYYEDQSANAPTYSSWGAETPGPTILAADAGSYTLTGLAAETLINHVLQADAGSYALTGLAAVTTVSGDTVMAADTGSYVLTGLAATTIKSGNVVMEADAGAYTLTGLAATTIASGAVTLADVYGRLTEIWQLMGLDASNPLTVTTQSRDTGTISQTITGDGTTTTTVTRN